MIEFDCPSLLEPPQVTVPAVAVWTERMPPWARDRRELIVARLRASGAVVLEADRDLTSILSPDSTFRIDCIIEYDDRAPAWERTRIVGVPGERELAYLPLHKVFGAVQFPGRGLAVLPLRSRFGETATLRANVRAGTFVLDPGEPEQPLAKLQSRFPYPPAGAARTADRPLSRRAQFGNLMLAFLALLFVPAGIWMSMSAATTKDRLIGAGGVVFFGGGAFLWMVELQRRWRRLAPYVPLLAMAAEIPWVVTLFAGLLFLIGDAPFMATAAQENVVLAGAVMPALAGVAWGLVAIAAGRSRRPIATAALLLGLLGCAAIVAGAVWTMARRPH